MVELTGRDDLRSWIDPRVEIRSSPLGGNGMFAREAIKKGAVVVVWGGVILRKADIQAGNFKRGSLSAIAEDVWLGDPPNAQDDDANYTNHSCDPNLWMKDEVTLIAKRDIEVGEELTADYILWEANEEFVANWECNCGSRLCRKRITGRDWMIPELQERYRGHFSPFLNRRIETKKSLADDRI